MGMSTNIVGFKPPDQKWQQMKLVWDACVVAKIPAPSVVSDFFNGEPPDDAGVTVELRFPNLHESVKRFTDDGSEGFQVDITKLPKDVTIVRFYNSW